jgi:hypothetical protein
MRRILVKGEAVKSTSIQPASAGSSSPRVVRVELDRRALLAEEAGVGRSHVPAGIPGQVVRKAVGVAGIGGDEHAASLGLQVEVLQPCSRDRCPHDVAHRAPIVLDK